MSDSKNGTGRGSVRDISSMRPRRGRVKLVRIDPSETNGVKRRDGDERTVADDEHIMSLQECRRTPPHSGVVRQEPPPGFVVPANRDWAASQLLIETMEEMKLIYPKPHLDVRALKKSLQAAA
jgi:hypothetical protein